MNDGLISPEQQIKSALEGGAQLSGAADMLADVDLRKMIKKQFEMVFCKQNETAIYLLLVEIQQQEDWWKQPPELYED